jgi:hypothetical protein
MLLLTSTDNCSYIQYRLEAKRNPYIKHMRYYRITNGLTHLLGHLGFRSISQGKGLPPSRYWSTLYFPPVGVKPC